MSLTLRERAAQWALAYFGCTWQDGHPYDDGSDYPSTCPGCDLRAVLDAGWAALAAPPAADEDECHCGRTDAALVNCPVHAEGDDAVWRPCVCGHSLSRHRSDKRQCFAGLCRCVDYAEAAPDPA